jgi:hypothetical protein
MNSMNIFILIGSAIILYPVPGTVLGILLTLVKTDNLKLKIALLAFLRPLVYTGILGLIFFSTFNNSMIWLSCFLIAVILRDIIFGTQKYLFKLTINSDYISIEYINALLRTKNLKALIAEDKILALSEMKSITDYPPSLIFSDNDDKQRFVILSKSIWRCANQEVNAAKIGLGAMAGTE